MKLSAYFLLRAIVTIAALGFLFWWAAHSQALDDPCDGLPPMLGTDC